MVYDSLEQKWKIMMNKSILAFTKQTTSELPLGLTEWKVVGNGNGNGSYLTEMLFNFHLAKTQPGNFCCDDGLCIDSELVCDNIPNCRDKSDEKNCNMIRFPKYIFETNRPPSKVVNINKKDVFTFVDLHATLTVLDILDINDAETSYDIFFILTVKWKDFHLKYEFLKENAALNAINDTTFDTKIWSPEIQFFHVTGESVDFGRKIFVEKNGASAYLSADIDDLYPREIYDGDDCLINLGKPSTNLFK